VIFWEISAARFAAPAPAVLTTNGHEETRTGAKADLRHFPGTWTGKVALACLAANSCLWVFIRGGSDTPKLARGIPRRGRRGSRIRRAGARATPPAREPRKCLGACLEDLCSWLNDGLFTGRRAPDWSMKRSVPLREIRGQTVWVRHSRLSAPASHSLGDGW
jgi:hypothetical protein